MIWKIYDSPNPKNNYRELYPKKEICQTKNPDLIQTDFILGSLTSSQSLPQFAPTICGLFRRVYIYFHVAIDARTDLEEPLLHLVQPPAARNAAG